MIAALYNIPTDAAGLARFSFHNRDAHVLANQAILSKLGINLPEYPIDPILMEDFPSWLYSHQAMHNAVNAVLGTQGNDLTDVDPTQIDQLSAWIQIHASEHVSWGNLLNIG